MRFIRAVFVSVTALGLCKVGHAELLELPSTTVLDIHRSDPGRVNRQPSLDRIVSIAESKGAATDRIGRSVAVEELDLDVGRLITANDGSDGADENYFSMVVDRKEYVLDVVESVFDPVFGMHHVLAAIANGVTPDAYARFTIDPGTGTVAGTIQNGLERYRIISGNDSRSQLVFPLGRDRAGADRVDMVASVGAVAASVERVERRHAQAERIAEIKPYIFSYPENGFTTRLVDGDLGEVALGELDDPQTVARLLKDLSVFTRATGNEDFEIVAVNPSDRGGRQIQFRQLISGVPVDFTSTLLVDAEGKVQSLLTRVIDPSAAPAVLVSKDEALSIASKEIENKFGPQGIINIQWGEPRLTFETRAESPTEYGIVLQPKWHVPVLVETSTARSLLDGSAAIEIDANTAEAQIRQSIGLE